MKQRLKMRIVPAARLYAKFALCCLGAMILSASPGIAGDTPAPQALTEVAKRPLAPDFALEDIDGKKRRLSDLRGKVVLVNFWATWCPPCRREMPSIERLSRILKGPDFEVLAVNVGENLDTVFSFTGTLDPVPTFPIVFDRDSRVLKAWPVRGLPATFILDKEGRIAYRAVGGREFDDPVILTQIRSLINDQKGITSRPVK
jgi:thiol-disulfide isomerase/thioredoxin